MTKRTWNHPHSAQPRLTALRSEIGAIGIFGDSADRRENLLAARPKLRLQLRREWHRGIGCSNQLGATLIFCGAI